MYQGKRRAETNRTDIKTCGKNLQLNEFKKQLHLMKEKDRAQNINFRQKDNKTIGESQKKYQNYKKNQSNKRY